MPVAENGPTILLGEDDLEVCHYLKTALRCQGYAVEVAHSGEEVLTHFQTASAPVSAIVLEVVMPQRDGIDTLKEIRRLDRDVPIIMISGFASPLNLGEAMNNGANDFLVKPINPEDLRKALRKALQAKPGVPALPEEQKAVPANKHIFFSASPGMQELQSLLDCIGWSEAPVLIRGETGVGKEVFARELHARSPRAKRPILKLNCAALPSELVESELFGYERGAFTGAFQRKPGMFEFADGGTLLLDEIGDMDWKLQAKLLQVLQDSEFQRLGGKETIRVDVRIIAATHRDLEKAIAEGHFREDLYYRLNVISMRVPPLRERKEDVLALAGFLVRKHSAPGSTPIEIPPELEEVFLEYHWPGNIRELENTIRRFLILRNARLVAQDLHAKSERKPVNPVNGSMHVETAVELSPPEAWVMSAENGANEKSNGTPEGAATPILAQVAKTKREAERSAILAALKSTNWNRRQASALLQVDYKALLYKMKVLSIKKEPGGVRHLEGHSQPASEGHFKAGQR